MRTASGEVGRFEKSGERQTKDSLTSVSVSITGLAVKVEVESVPTIFWPLAESKLKTARMRKKRLNATSGPGQSPCFVAATVRSRDGDTRYRNRASGSLLPENPACDHTVAVPMNARPPPTMTSARGPVSSRHNSRRHASFSGPLGKRG